MTSHKKRNKSGTKHYTLRKSVERLTNKRGFGEEKAGFGEEKAVFGEKKRGYVVAIPSYKRADVLVQKTLQTLKQGHVDPKNIYIFVANQEEYEQYAKIVPKELYHKIVIGKKGITHQRIFISNYFPEGTYVVSIDDDVEQLSRRVDDSHLAKVRNLDTFFEKAGETLKKEGLFLWGIYPVHNPFFMKPGKTTGLTFIIGVLHGYIVRKDPSLHPSISLQVKEDYHQSILYFIKDGGVIRFNDISPKTKFYSEGGLGISRVEMNENAANYLAKTYPSIVRIFHRKNGTAEIRLARLSRGEKIE